MEITDTVIDDSAWDGCDIAAIAERAARATLLHLDLDPDAWEIAVLACDDDRIAALNAEFRGKPTPTNVLSWPSEDRAPDTPGTRPAPPEGPDPELGDIAIAHGTCVREAAEAEKTLEDHATHLMVHAVLHLLGYDHVDDADAAVMEALETVILGKMGLSDPYE